MPNPVPIPILSSPRQRMNGITSSSDTDRLDANLSDDITGAPPAKPRKSKLSFAAVDQDSYEPVRVPRPAGMPEWGPGVRPEEEAPKKGSRKEDRWV